MSNRSVTIEHTVGAPAKIDPCRARVKGPDLIFWKNVEMPKKGRKLVEAYFFRKSQIHFLGLRTLKLAIWTTYFQFFPIFSQGVDLISWTDFGQIFPISL